MCRELGLLAQLVDCLPSMLEALPGFHTQCYMNWAWWTPINTKAKEVAAGPRFKVSEAP